MASHPLQSLKSKLSVAALAYILIQMHWLVIKWAGFNWKISAYDSIINNILLLLCGLLIAQILRFYLPGKNRYAFIAALSIMVTVIWYFSSRFIVFILIGDAEYRSFFTITTPVRIAIGVLVLECITLMSILIYTIEDKQQSIRRKNEIEKLVKETELSKLRQQLQPHFLFNSLNSINALMISKPEEARMMIQQLSDFLRGTLKKEENNWITLEEELKHLQLYLSIEKVRFGYRLQTKITDETAGQRLKIPAMLLQPIVENAIKFGLYDTTGEILISIHTQKKENDLEVIITNPFDHDTGGQNHGTGFGLSSVERRLFLLFSRNQLLKTEIRENIFITTIHIPQLYD